MKGDIFFFFTAQALLRNNMQQQLCAEMNWQDTLKSKRTEMVQGWITGKTFVPVCITDLEWHTTGVSKPFL